VQKVQAHASGFNALLGVRMDESIVTFTLVVLGGIAFCVFVVLSTMRKHKVWLIPPYAISLIPAGMQARNHGFNTEVIMAACFFLVLTWVILYCAKKELGESPQ
jgi:hypothetical protein